MLGDEEHTVIDTVSPRVFNRLAIPPGTVASLLEITDEEADAFLASHFSLPVDHPRRIELVAVIDMYTMLVSVLGAEEQINLWLNGHNYAFGGATPLELLRTHAGLHRVLAYLRASLG